MPFDPVVLEELAVLTAVENETTPSLFPRDLQTTNGLLDVTVEFLVQDLMDNPEDALPFSEVGGTSGV